MVVKSFPHVITNKDSRNNQWPIIIIVSSLLFLLRMYR